MKIVVVGGRGRIGSRLVRLLACQGHEVVAASRRSGVDVVTGDGLAEALRAAAVVVDVSDAPSFEDAAARAFFTAATRTILAGEAAAGVGHHVLLSVAGIDGVAGGYYRAKAAQEQLVAASSMPYTIVRATQFFEFLDAIADAATHGGVVRIPPAHVQPIAADDVASVLARIATEPPANTTVEIGGPESFYLDALLRRVLGARRDPRSVSTDRHADYLGMHPGDRSLVAGDEAELGQVRFEQWLNRTTPSDHERAYEFPVGDVPPGSVLLTGDVAVFSVEGGFCATQARCTHRRGPLSEGAIDGSTVTCPLHGARFNVWTGAVLRGPATQSLETYAVTIDGDVGRVEGAGRRATAPPARAARTTAR
jgi:uncharacterized protein YbjT (DUF2867 family)/nitrite reductase/ring-hydroxylating ferredoxin subunit